ncbi:phosphatidate cytidylyltransferase [Bacillus licheniformis]|nr:phosphatidate cytidylyltransferase [Bacillus licheniformis]
MAVLCFGIYGAQQNSFTFDEAAFVALAAVYIGFGFITLLKSETSDSAMSFCDRRRLVNRFRRLFIGKAFGKRKLWPEISPNKR